MVEVRCTGYFNYHAVPGNLASFGVSVTGDPALDARATATQPEESELGHGRGDRAALAPPTSILHPYPNLRFDANIRVRARCSNPARADLCGGRQSMASLPRPLPLKFTRGLPTGPPSGTSTREVPRGR